MSAIRAHTPRSGRVRSVTSRTPLAASSGAASSTSVAPTARASRPCPCAGRCPRCTAAGPGHPLDASVRRRAESGFGADLSGVRVHTDPAATDAARAQGARAFTVGQHLFFGRDQYAPHTTVGERRLVHELSHVVQQRRGRPAGGVTPARYTAAEREGRHAADAVLGGARTTLAERTAGSVQRDGPGDGPSDGPPTPRLMDPSEFQLHLDPEIQAMMMRNYLRWWVGSTLTLGEPAAGASGAGTAGAGAPGPDASSPATPGVPAPQTYTPARLATDPLPPNFFTPIAPAVLGPDVGALMAPYGTRGVPLATRDVDAALAIYRSNAQFVSLLPDLRSMAPSWLRPIIPNDWRRSIVGAFTAATIDAQIRHDFPTPIEVADRTYEHITGISTTYIPIPGFSF